ncbi:hypothetical protein ACW17M_07525 [Vreelandella sp. 2A-K22]
MAKLRPDAVGKSTLAEYLTEVSDFGFELSVLKMLRDLGIGYDHGGHYEDPVTKKSREFDIRATATFGQLRLRMAIECKNIKENFPILVSCVPRQHEESYHQIAMVRELDRTPGMLLHIERSRANVLSIFKEHTIYQENDPVGKSTAQVGRDLAGNISANDSELFEKWGQCLASAQDLVDSMYWDGDEDDPEDAYISAIIPFVVIPDDRLWVVNYSESGDQASEPVQTNRCSCFVNKQYRMNSISPEYILVSHVEIVTISGLQNFIQQYATSEDALSAICTRAGILAAVERDRSKKA